MHLHSPYVFMPRCLTKHWGVYMYIFAFSCLRPSFRLIPTLQSNQITTCNRLPVKLIVAHLVNRSFIFYWTQRPPLCPLLSPTKLIRILLYCSVFGYWDTPFGLLVGFISVVTSRNYTWNRPVTLYILTGRPLVFLCSPGSTADLFGASGIHLQTANH
jgi:hypothetical protein